MTLFYLALAWLSGIALAHVMALPSWLWLILACLAGGITIYTRRHVHWRVVFACGALFALGGMRLVLAQPSPGPHDLASYHGGGIATIHGVVVAMPDPRETHTNLRVRVHSLSLADGTQVEVDGLALVQARNAEGIRYGDPVEASGLLSAPPVFDDFSYRDYLARQGVYSLLRFASVRITGPREANPLRAVLVDFRSIAHIRIQRLLPDPQAALLSGILLGIESGISPEAREAFNRTDTTHIIAISGANMVIVAGLVAAVARRFTQGVWMTVITIAGVLVYAAFVGGDAAVTRAAIMTTLYLVAQQLGRETYGPASLAFAALLLTAVNPLTLWDLSFQLSFLATLGLILYVDPLQKGLQALLERLGSSKRAGVIVGVLSDALLVTIAALITTRPLLAFYTGRFSLVSLPTNLLIVPLQTPIMVLGGLGVLLSFVLFPAGQVLTWGAWLFLSLTLWVVRGFAALPFASLDLHDVPAAAVWGSYLVIFGLTALLSGPAPMRERRFSWLRQALSTKLLAGTGVLVAALAIAAAVAMPDGRLHVHVFDVGAGEAALITSPSGRQILVNAGGSTRELLTGLGDALPFWDHRIDLIVLTGGKQDHIQALERILRRYHVETALVPAGLDPAIMASLTQQEVRVIQPVQGTTFSVGDGLSLEIAGVAGSAEDEPGSLMVRLIYQDASFLWLSESLPDALQITSERTPAVVIIPRAQAESSNLSPWMERLAPQAAVLNIDPGEDVPDPDLLAWMETHNTAVYRTDQQGTVRCTSDGERLWFDTER